MFNKSGKSGHLCSVPHIRGIAVSSSLLSALLAVGLSYMALLFWGVFSPCPLCCFSLDAFSIFSLSLIFANLIAIYV